MWHHLTVRFFGLPGRDVRIMALGTGFKPTHRLETGTKLDFVAAHFPLGPRGVNVPPGESIELEIHLRHFGSEPIEVGTRWLLDWSSGQVSECIVTKVHLRSTELFSDDRPFSMIS
jgi:hypothetical protein